MFAWNFWTYTIKMWFFINLFINDEALCSNLKNGANQPNNLNIMRSILSVEDLVKITIRLRLIDILITRCCSLCSLGNNIFSSSLSGGILRINTVSRQLSHRQPLLINRQGVATDSYQMIRINWYEYFVNIYLKRRFSCNSL